MNSDDVHSSSGRRGRGFVTGGIALALVVLFSYGFVTVFAPMPYEVPVSPFGAYDSAPMQAALATGQVEAAYQVISGFGSRFMGAPGTERTYTHIRDAYAAAGLELIETVSEAPAPVTIERSLTGISGQPLAGVDIYPFFPNTFQPMVTPAGGITGRLVAATRYPSRDHASLSGAIVVADLADPTLRVNWKELLMLGAEAIVLTHADGMQAIPWMREDVQAVAGGASPLNLVRVAATPALLGHLGEAVCLTVRTAWRNVPHRTVLGVMRAAEPAGEALVVNVAYDAFSMLPDLAENTFSAVPVAIHLQVLEGMQAYRNALKRDVYFLASGGRMSASAGDRQVLQFVGSHGERREIASIWKGEADANRLALAQVERLHAMVQSPGFMTDAAVTEALHGARPVADRTFFREQLRHVINTLGVEKNTRVMECKSLFEQEGGSDVRSEAFARYLEASGVYNQVQARAGDPLSRLMTPGRTTVSFVERFGLAELVKARFAELQSHHRQRQAFLDVGLRIGGMFVAYRHITAFEPRLIPSSTAEAPEIISFLAGRSETRHDAVFADLLRGALHRLPEEDRPGVETHIGKLYAHDNRVRSELGLAGVSFAGADLWSVAGYSGITLVNTGRKTEYDRYADPLCAPGSAGDFGTLQRSLKATAETVLTIAFGNGRFSPPKKKNVGATDYTGSVYASGVGRSIVPNHPVTGALVGRYSGYDRYNGFLSMPLVFTDVYGRYALRFTPLPFGGDTRNLYSPTAVSYGPDGRIQFVKDTGENGQKIFASEGINTYSRNQGGRDINIVVFRAVPVTLPDMINPQTLRTFSDVQILRRRGLQPFASANRMQTPGEGMMTVFVPPAERFHVTFTAGSPDNEAVQSVRAFTLGDDPGYVPDPDVEIDGPGFLGELTPVLRNMPWHTTRAMARVNERRLELQRRHGMADKLTLEFQQRGEERLAKADAGTEPYRDRLQSAREALTYAILNHPVIRGNVTEAVIGIIWYLGLLVPFILFFEKLVFGYTDIRKQLLAHLLIFVTVFAMLRMLHPAFQMLRSSLMILLGFIIFMITTVVTLLLSGKFKENLEAIRQKQARVKGAEVNTTGVLVTAFMLGLNNMHRRKVRTGLTCATLVLLTFVMICFTSVQSNVVATATAIGRAAYQGLLIKNAEFAAISEAERSALDAKYGHRFRPSSRSAYFGTQTWSQETFNPLIEAATLPADGMEKRGFRFSTCLLFDYAEPLAGSLELLTTRGWFTSAQQHDAQDPVPVMIPDTAAAELLIRPADVDAGNVFLTVSGTRCEVVGVFSAQSLAALRDLDGRGLLPFDILAVQSIRRSGWEVLAAEDSPRLAAGQTLLSLGARFPGEVPVMAGSDRVSPRLVSVAVAMPRQDYETLQGEAKPAVSYRDAREALEGYLEQSGRATYYGLDRFAYFGRRARTRSLGGLIDMLIPLVIAALTVVNTMRGSVYERRSEIFVYNAVGIAPRYIFFMFFAEAFVYSVTGAMLGYLLSQGTGSFLTLMGWTGGLNMNFTSLATVYASLTIAGAVFLSTWFPARSAMEIAAPAEDAGWKLPEPEGDRMRFMLPFTFDRHDRIAVLGFFARYFEDHGEGSSGAFFAGEPVLDIAQGADAHGGGGAVPEVSVTIWLKPFDLAVSQRLVIQLPTDPETGEYIADVTLTRLSGSVDSWERLNRRFVGRVRRHFLHWRAVTPAIKAEFYTEAAARLQATEAVNA